MAPYESGDTATGPAGPEDSAGAAVTPARRRAARYVVPVAVLGVAAATISLVPALADSGDPDLPKISAEKLIAKIAASDVQQVSGTVKISTDLGLPDLGGLTGGMPGGGSSREGGASADPQQKLTELASGTHTLRVAADGPDKQKLSVLEQGAEYSVIHNGTDLWAYDSAANAVYHAKGEAAGKDRGHRGHVPEGAPATPGAMAREVLKASADTTSVTVDGTAQVAGRDAYRLVVKPKGEGSTVGAATIAVDAKTGTPLKFTLTPAAGGSAIVDAGYTKVDFGKPAAGTFDFRPPKGAEVTEGGSADHKGRPGLPGGLGGLDGLSGLTGGRGADGAHGRDAIKVIGKGWQSIARITLPAGAGLPVDGSDRMPAEAKGMLDALGDKASGKFGSGRVFSTRLVNALITEDGKVYVGAVTKSALVKAADAGH
ncbi:outer membrane lipoprotein carrier protein LolA [Streptomyces sp. NPDC058045]|uniref:LolA family protein n=1 Tax=Streptomyces sp. NPDC058045 TaxID=3346311 RepID=UPI0036EF13C0